MNNHYFMAIGYNVSIEFIRTSKREISYYVQVFYLHCRENDYDFKQNME